jgi:hypothetical protein
LAADFGCQISCSLAKCHKNQIAQWAGCYAHVSIVKYENNRKNSSCHPGGMKNKR